MEKSMKIKNLEFLKIVARLLVMFLPIRAIPLKNTPPPYKNTPPYYSPIFNKGGGYSYLDRRRRKIFQDFDLQNY